MAKKKTNQIILYSIVAVMVLSMGTFGVGSAITGARSQDVVSVGGSAVDANAYANALQNNISRYEDSTGKDVSISEAELVGIPEATVRNLIGGAVLEEIARTEGIRARDVDVAEFIQGIDAFQRADGGFDRDAYNSYLTRAQISPKEFEESIRKDLTKEIVNDAVLASTPNFDAISLTILKQRAKRIGLDYLELSSIHLPNAIEPPTDSELQAYYDENTDLFLQSEVKLVDVAYLTPALIAESLSENEIRAAFDADPAQFVKPETREVLVLAFPSEEAAKEITADGFEAEIEARGLTIVEVTESYTAHDALNAIETAIFESNEGELVGPVSSDFGATVYKIVNVTPAIEEFDALKDEVKTTLAARALETQIDENYDGLVDIIANGGLPADIAAGNGMNFASIRLGEDVLAGVTDDTAFQSEVNAAQAQENRDLFNLENGGLAYIYIQAIEDPKPLPFDEAKDDIRALIMQERETVAKEAFLDGLDARLNAGESLDDLAAEIGVEVTHQAPALVMELATLAPISLVLNVFDETTPDVTTAIESQKFYIGVRGEIVDFDENDPQNAALLQESHDAINARLQNMQQDALIREASQEFGTEINRGLQSQVHVQLQ